MKSREVTRRDNLNLVLDDVGPLVNESELFSAVDTDLPSRYLALTRDSAAGVWARGCDSISDAEKIFTSDFLAENAEELARLPLALADLDKGTITHEIHVSVSVEGRPQPLAEPDPFFAG